MISLKRTSYDDPDFGSLIKMLDKDLWVRYPDTQQNYAGFYIIKPDANVVVAYYGGEAAGCGCYRNAGSNCIVEIKRMYVREDMRGLGLAQSILKELEAWAVEEGGTGAVLETGIRNHEAVSLYMKLGYGMIDKYEPYVNSAESICMGKSFHR